MGSNPAGGAILPEPKRHFIAQSLSSSPFHRPEMTEILLKGRKSLTHPSILPSSSSTPNTTHPHLYPILPLSLLKFGRNDSRPKRPRAETTHLLRPKRPTPKIGRNDLGRNDPAETTRIRSHGQNFVCFDHSVPIPICDSNWEVTNLPIFGDSSPTQ